MGIEIRSSTTSCQPLLPRRLSQLGPGVAWCDLNGDGRDDLVIGAGRGEGLAVFLNDARGGFTRVELPGWPVAGPDDQTGIVAWSPEPGRTVLLVGQANYESGDTGQPAVVRHELFLGSAETTPLVPGGFGQPRPAGGRRPGWRWRPRCVRRRARVAGTIPGGGGEPDSAPAAGALGAG